MVTVVWTPSRGLALGDTDAGWGPAMTVKRPVPVPLPPSGLETVIACAPAVAPCPTVTGTLKVVELITVTAPNVTFASLQETAAPFWKAVPVIVTVWTLPWAPESGDVPVTVGAALTVN